MAVADGDVDRVRTLLQGGADPNHPVYLTEQWWSKEYGEWKWRTPPLHTACEEAMLQMVKLLVQHGADIDRGDGRDGQTPLHRACYGGNKEVVVYLTMEAGCKVGELIDMVHSISNFCLESLSMCTLVLESLVHVYSVYRGLLGPVCSTCGYH